MLDLSGSGAPTSPAPIGTRYTDLTAGALWVMAATGWVALTGAPRNTGIIQLTPALMTGGQLMISRAGDVVTLHANELLLSTATQTSGTIYTLPVGWRPADTVSMPWGGLTLRAQTTRFGHVQLYNWSASRIDGSMAWVTTDPQPA